MLGTSPQPEGITNPPIDDLLEKVDSKYGLVVEAAKRAKSLGIALREIAEDKLEVIPGDIARARRAEAEEARRAAEADMFSDISLDAPVSLEEGETTTSLDDIQF